MSKRRSQEAEIDLEDSAPIAKRISPLLQDDSEDEALNCLNKLSSFLGLGDLSQESVLEGPSQTPFIGTSKTVRSGPSLLPITILPQYSSSRYRKGCFFDRHTETKARRNGCGHYFAFDVPFGASDAFSGHYSRSSRRSSELELARRATLD